MSRQDGVRKYIRKKKKQKTKTKIKQKLKKLKR